MDRDLDKPGLELLLRILEAVAFGATAVFAILWVRDPGGDYEPWTVICGVVTGGIELFRRFRPSGPDVATSSPSPDELLPQTREGRIIEWIQRNGADKPLSQVLPRVLQLARIDGDHEMERWLRMELYGYSREGGMKETDSVPEYREISVRHFDQFGRMLHIDDPQLGFVNSYRLRYGVRQLEELGQKSDPVYIRDEMTIALISEHFGVDIVQFCFSPVDVLGIIDTIRNRALEYVNEVERKSAVAPIGARPQEVPSSPV